MCKIIGFFVLLVFCLTSKAFAYRCYSDFCHNKTSGLRNSGPECILTSIQRGKDCVNLRFENLGHTSPVGDTLGKFKLSAYVKDFGSFDGKATAFNLSISDVKFYRLITRYQESGDDRQAACREIEIYNGRDREVLFPELFVACPFADEFYEAVPYRLEYLAVGRSYEYSRKLVFIVPRHQRMDENTNDVRMYVPFVYVDVSNTATLSLHIQPLPEKFNVTRYKVWLINNDTNIVISVEVNLNENQDIQYNFSVVEGVHYFKVAAMHPICGKYGCANSTTPLISTKQPTRRLLIMIISVVWIPPAIAYAMYYAYKMYMKNVLAKRGHRRMNCLLVYSPTHVAHVDVMKKLALYMRSCNINAMIDMLNIPETLNKDPGLWCNSAFQSADVIIVATSPPPSDVVVPVIYHNMDNHVLRLLKENYSRRNKRYFVVQFPYCNRDDVPEEAKLFRRFDMPQELNKLVRNIYGVDRVRFFGAANKEFVESIKQAMSEIPQGACLKIDNDTGHKVEPFSDELLPSAIKHGEINLEQKLNLNKSCEVKDTPDDKECRRYFTTNIDELNLLGDNGEGETFIYTPSTSQAEFRIDRLNL